jgi:hypothetical protein
MSMQHCDNCDRNIDTDLDAEHFMVGSECVCNTHDDSPRYSLDEKVDMYYEPANYHDLEE